MAHRHFCLTCSAVVADGDFDCEADADHDFEYCAACAAAYIAAKQRLTAARERFQSAHLASLRRVGDPDTQTEYDNALAEVRGAMAELRAAN